MRSYQAFVERAVEDLYIKLGKFLKEVFTLNLQDKCNRERELLLISSTRNCFGAAAGKILLDEMMDKRD